MFSKAFFAALLYVASAQQFSISTPPSLVQCEVVSLSWSGGSTPPYNLAAIPGGQPSAPALVNIATTQSSPYAWTVNVAAGTSVTVKITDSQGNIAYSSQLTVQTGPSTSCLSAGSSSSSGNSTVPSTGTSGTTGSSGSSGASSAAGNEGVASTSAAAAGAASAGSQTASKSASTGPSGTAGAAASSSSKGAAGRSAIVGGALGVAGVLAAVIVA